MCLYSSMYIGVFQEFISSLFILYPIHLIQNISSPIMAHGHSYLSHTYTSLSKTRVVDYSDVNENVPHRTMYLNTWFSVGGAVWGGYGTRCSFVEEIYH